MGSSSLLQLYVQDRSPFTSDLWVIQYFVVDIAIEQSSEIFAYNIWSKTDPKWNNLPTA